MPKHEETWQTNRWRTLLAAAEEITSSLDRAARRGGTLDDCIATTLERLQVIKNRFPPAVDPVDDFEGFCVRELTKALERLFSRLDSQG